MQQNYFMMSGCGTMAESKECSSVYVYMVCGCISLKIYSKTYMLPSLEGFFFVCFFY